jgi:phage tail-like protein
MRTKIPGNIKTNNITLRRGMTSSRTIWNWFDAVQSGKRDQQRNGSLTIYDQAGKAQALFSFQRAWPLSYVLTDVNASSNDIEIEEIEIVVEEFKREEVPKDTQSKA